MTRLVSELNRQWTKFWLAVIFITQASLLTWSAWVHSPTWDELGHLAAGISHWKTGRFDLYAVNPPLTRVIAAAPVVLFDEPQMDWSVYRNNASLRSEVYLGRRMVELNGPSINRRFFLARLTLIPIALLGTWLCFAFSQRIFGASAGILAASLWAFSPSVLAYGSVVTPDLSSAVIVFTVAYGFLRWLELRSWSSTGLLSVSLGTAMLVKSVWIFLPVALLVAWALYDLWSRGFRRPNGRSLTDLVSLKPWKASFAQLCTASVSAILLVNCFYGFQGSFRSLGNYTFVSATLSGVEPCIDCGEPGIGNRFASSWMAFVPVPLPAAYVSGIDVQRSDFEKGLTSPAWKSYLLGEWKQGGWWYFYLVGLFYKEPLALWALVVLATLSAVWMPPDKQQRLWLFALVVPTLMLLFLISINTGLNRYVRYALPILPFIFVWSSQVARFAEPSMRSINRLFKRVDAQDGQLSTASRTLIGRPQQATSIVVLLTWLCFIGGSLWQGPHWLSFFNTAAGGPYSGYQVLCDSNVDWGQDLPELQQWLNEHPEAKQSLNLAFFGSYDPMHFGIRYRLPPSIKLSAGVTTAALRHLYALEDGWYVISKNYLLGHSMPVPDGRNRLEFQDMKSPSFTYLNLLEPVGSIGNSMFVYHVGPEQRQQLMAALRNSEAGKGLSAVASTKNSSVEIPIYTPSIIHSVTVSNAKP